MTYVYMTVCADSRATLRIVMPPPATTEEFLHCLRTSKLVTTAQIQPYRERLAPLAMPREMAAAMIQDGLLTPFQAQQILHGRHKNFFINKYKILEPIGSGGMGKVLLCEHMLMHQRVALKMLPRQKNEDPSRVARFIREAQAAASLDHPNIVRAHDLDCSNEKYMYFVMDYVEGVSLHDLTWKRGGLEPDYAAHYVAQVAAGLQHIYEAGLVHRDLKPANLLLDRTGIVKILDMGLALFQDDQDRITERYNDQTLLGTADFISPEQTILRSDVDIRSDIYCLGCTFYFLLTGRVPFDDNLIVQKLIGHQQREPKPIRELRPNVPAEFIEVHRRMTMKKPEQRYQTPAELLDALAPWATLEVPPPAEHELPKLSKASQGARNSGTHRPLRSSSLMMRQPSRSRLEAVPNSQSAPVANSIGTLLRSFRLQPRWRTAATLAAVVTLTAIAAFSMLAAR
jgi:serine/threonine protein kinase